MFDLRPFQAQAIEDLRAGARAGHRRQVLAIPTGGGKTVVAAHIALAARDRGHRALFIVDRIELVSQAARTFNAMGLSVGILRGEDTCFSESDDVIVASIQTIAKRRAPDWVRLVIIDECHILHKAHIRLMESWNALPFIGLSATPLRPGLGKHFTNLVRGPSVRELTEQGFLVPSHGFAPAADAIAQALSGVAVGNTVNGKDYREKDLAATMNCKRLVGDIVSTWQEKAADRPTLCFAVDIAHSKSIAEDFAAAGVAVAHLDGHTPDHERQRLIGAFRAGDIRILTSVYVLGIGFDVPDASCLILARPTLSEMLHFQQLGRGIRTAPGKVDCLVLDHAGNTHKHGLPYHFEVPDLDDGTAPERSKAKKKEPRMVSCSECGALMETGEVTCLACGMDRPRKRSAVVYLDGRLAEFGAVRAAQETVDRRAWYLAMRWHCEQSGKSPGLAFHLFKSKFPGDKPPWAWRDLPSVEPTTEQARWIRNEMKRRSIAWRKGQVA